MNKTCCRSFCIKLCAFDRRTRTQSMNNYSEMILAMAEINCYRRYNGTDASLSGYCEAVFDSLMCWPPTKAGETSYQSCTNDYVNSKLQAKASKLCTPNGTWYSRSNDTATHYTNYSLCGMMWFDYKSGELDLKDLTYNKWLPIIKNISYFGYILSIVSLVVALLIFIGIKRLHCQRNTLHIHLFMTFLLKAAMFVINDALFVQGTALVNEVDFENGAAQFTKTHYSWVCKAIVSLRNYFIVSNFMMVLMEGMYLHNLMFLNLFSDNHDVSIYYGAGWGISFIFVNLWVIMQAVYDDTMCWTIKNKITLLLDVPIGVTVVVNFILFVLIVRVLFLKLNMICIQQRRIKYRKLLKSTLILIPLFGIPYFISFCLQFWVNSSQLLELTWLLFDQTFSAFQGFFASLVYCLLNSEVQTEIKRKYSSIKDRNNKEFRRSRTISHTQQFSLPLNDDNNDNLQNYGDELNRKKTADCYF
ncbi:unnamed protein product [Brassicogethes aeneus]|uniref:Uncharacterized protein n=1 Tax=Brassicogethes aeneus TaxID=1431903 RepID=A0A9P0FKH9_BRAAE|nr:unnamed protein product [Brassicogethes aeneus]